MRLQIQLPDELYDLYQEQATTLAGATGPVGVETLLVDRLTRFSAVQPSDRVVVVDNKSRQELEAILSGGSLMDAADLIAKVKKLASIEFGVVRLDFTPGQLNELKGYARRNGIPVEEAVRRTVKGIEALFFQHVGG